MSAVVSDRLAGWRAAPVVVKAFLIVAVAGGAREWAYSPHVRANPGPAVIADGLILLLTFALMDRRRWSWIIFALDLLVGVTGLFPSRHPVHAPTAVNITLDATATVVLFSPPMLRWVGIRPGTRGSRRSA